MVEPQLTETWDPAGVVVTFVGVTGGPVTVTAALGAEAGDDPALVVATTETV